MEVGGGGVHTYVHVCCFFFTWPVMFLHRKKSSRIVGLNRNHAAAFRHRGELPALILKLLLVHPVENFEAGLSLCVPRVFRSDRDFRISRIHWRHSADPSRCRGRVICGFRGQPVTKLLATRLPCNAPRATDCEFLLSASVPHNFPFTASRVEWVLFREIS